jgi:hypothetical protein
MIDFLSACALIGTTLIVVRSTALRFIQRLWPAFFQCSQCVGFWTGAAAGGSGLIQTGHGRILDAFVVGAASSFASMFADAVMLKLLGDPNEGNTP